MGNVSQESSRWRVVRIEVKSWLGSSSSSSRRESMCVYDFWRFRSSIVWVSSLWRLDGFCSMVRERGGNGWDEERKWG